MTYGLLTFNAGISLAASHDSGLTSAHFIGMIICALPVIYGFCMIALEFFSQRDNTPIDNPTSAKDNPVFVNMLPWVRQQHGKKMVDFKGCPCRVSVNYGCINEPLAVDITFLKDHNYYSFKKFYSKISPAPEGVDTIADGEILSVLGRYLNELHAE